MLGINKNVHSYIISSRPNATKSTSNLGRGKLDVGYKQECSFLHHILSPKCDDEHVEFGEGET